MPSLRSFVPTAANCRDSQKSSCARGKQDTKGREASPDQDKAIWRYAPHVAQDTAIARDALHGQDTAIRREASPVAEDGAITVSTASFRSLR